MRVFKIVGIIIVAFLILSIPIRNHFKNAYQRFIPWSQNNKLTWRDFRGKVTNDFTGTALTGSGYVYHERLIEDSIEISMINYFMADSSIVRMNLASDQVLNHEQRHFDVSEIYVRRLREYIQKWNGGSKTHYNAYLLDGVDSIYKDSLAYQYEYQTNHGHNIRYQKQWDSKIDSLLKVYDAYEKATFKMYWWSSRKDFESNFYDTYMYTRQYQKRTIDTRK